MAVITITRWRRKIIAVVIGAVILFGVGMGARWYFTRDVPTSVPTDNLQEDVLTQSVKVQGQAPEQNGVGPVESVTKSK